MIVFSNPGVIDVRGITTFGVNAKDESRNPIGHFGTGIKFAIATILRLGDTIRIQAGTTTYTFDVKADAVRGKEFNFVRMHTTGQDGTTATTELAFTTDLGKEWKPWQAYRELYCNAVTDEGGKVEEMDDSTPLAVAPDWTVVEVVGEFFAEEHRKREEFILEPTRRPLFVLPGCIEVYDGASKSVFYRGIRVGPMPNEVARYTYNVLGYLSLTEDRTMLFPSQFVSYVARAVVSGKDDDFTKDVLAVVDDNGDDRTGFETSIEYTGHSITERLYTIAREVIDKTKRNVHSTFFSGMRTYEKETLLSRRVDLTEHEQAELAHAIERCAAAGLAYDGKIEVVADLGAGETVYRDDRKKTMLLDISLFDDPEGLMLALATQMLEIKLGTTFGGMEYANRLTGAYVRDVGNMLSTAAPLAAAAAPEEPAPAGDSRVWVLIGTWSGYSSTQRKVAHREIVPAERAERLKNLHTIVYTDGTTLDITCEEMLLMDQAGFKELKSYDSLIRDAERSGQSSYAV